MNGTKEWPMDRQDEIQILAPQSKPIRGLDAHNAEGYLRDPRCICNEVEAGEWTEEKIIEWMKQR